MNHLKHASDGNLLRGSDGHLVHGCASAGCACAATPICSLCADATPGEFQVTFTGITLCAGCVNCPAAGVSLAVTPGSSIDGTYTLTHNGACAWTAFATGVPCTVRFYSAADCAGTPATISIAIQQVRISSTQFRLQITDSTNAILLFDAIVSAAACCAGYTVDSDLAACGCSTDGTTFTLATGGTATVIPC